MGHDPALPGQEAGHCSAGYREHASFSFRPDTGTKCLLGHAQARSDVAQPTTRKEMVSHVR